MRLLTPTGQSPTLTAGTPSRARTPLAAPISLKILKRAMILITFPRSAPARFKAKGRKKRSRPLMTTWQNLTIIQPRASPSPAIGRLVETSRDTTVLSGSSAVPIHLTPPPSVAAKSRANAIKTPPNCQVATAWTIKSALVAAVTSAFTALKKRNGQHLSHGKKPQTRRSGPSWSASSALSSPPVSYS